MVGLDTWVGFRHNLHGLHYKKTHGEAKSADFAVQKMVNLHEKNCLFSIKISKFLSVKAVIPLTVNKIASSGGFGPLSTSFPLYGSPLNGSFTVFMLVNPL